MAGDIIGTLGLIILGSVGGIVGTILILGYIAFTHYELLEKWYSVFTRIFARFSKKAELETVKHDIQSRITGYQKFIKSEFEGLMPYPVEIVWTKEEAREAIIEGDIVLVKMKPHMQQATNFMKVVMDYVNTGLIPNARKYVDEDLMKACDHTITKGILNRERKYNVFQEFMEELKEEKQEIRDYCVIMDRLHEEGLFTRILLPELSYLGEKLFPRNPNDYVFEETKEFTSILDELSQKIIAESSEEVPLEYDGDNIRAKIILIKMATLEKDGISPYKKAVDHAVNSDISSIYIIAGGKTGEYAKLLLKEVLRRYSNFEKIAEKEYTRIREGRHLKSLYILLKRRQSIEGG